MGCVGGLSAKGCGDVRKLVLPDRRADLRPGLRGRTESEGRQRTDHAEDTSDEGHRRRVGRGGSSQRALAAPAAADSRPSALRPHIEGAMPVAAAAVADTAADAAKVQDYPLLKEYSQAELASDLDLRKPAEMPYEIVCRTCGDRHTFMLKDEPSHARCAKCDAEIPLPSIRVVHQRQKEQQRRRR